MDDDRQRVRRKFGAAVGAKSSDHLVDVIAAAIGSVVWQPQPDIEPFSPPAGSGSPFPGLPSFHAGPGGKGTGWPEQAGQRSPRFFGLGAPFGSVPLSFDPWDDEDDPLVPIVLQLRDTRPGMHGEGPAALDQVRARPRWPEALLDLIAHLTHPGLPPPIYSFLTHSIHATAALSTIAEVAADDRISLADIPAPLTVEAAPVRAGGSPRTWADLVPGHDGSGIRIGLIDEVIDQTNPALSGRVLRRRLLPGVPLTAGLSHGTAMAGFIVGANAPWPRGTAPGASVHSFPIATSSGALFSETEATAALQDIALDASIRVVTCAWGTGSAFHGAARLGQAMGALAGDDRIVIKSAGNSGPGSGTLSAPANAPGVVSVGATSPASVQAAYSSRGPVDGRQTPDVLAPGGDAASPLAAIGVAAQQPTGVYGTSFAAALVSGVAACLVQQADATGMALRMPGDLQALAARSVDGVAAMAL